MIQHKLSQRSRGGTPTQAKAHRMGWCKEHGQAENSIGDEKTSTKGFAECC